MSRARLRVPVALLLFNRPRHTQRVLEAIRAARPGKLFAIADGPRPDRPGEAPLCEAARRVVDEMEPDCELIRDYSPVNLGCGRRVAGGLARVFEQVEEAIVLEDDCLPDPSFFRYCDDLLERYRHDTRVMMISGTNDLIEWKPEARSYHYSRYGSVWGWASWRRAWSHYDFEMRSWALPESRRRLAAALGDDEQRAHRSAVCEAAARGQIDTWDYQWTYARLVRGGLTAVPSRNLVSNIGFGNSATHTARRAGAGADLPRFPMSFPLRPPTVMEADRDYDRAWFGWQVGRPPAEAVISRAERLLAAQRHAETLVLLHASMARTTSRRHRAAFLVLKARALMALESPVRALDALDEALAISPDDASAIGLRDRISSRP